MRLDNLGPFSAYSVIGTATLMPLLVLPAMVGVLVDEAGMSESFAGWVASTNFLGGAAMALSMAFRIHGIDLRRAAAVGLALAIAGDSASAFAAHQGPLFLGLRFLTGFAAGAAHVAALTAFARHSNVERGYGLFITLQFIVSGTGLYVLPVYSTTLGVQGMFLMFAALQSIALLLVRFLPERSAAPADGAAIGGAERSILFATITLLAILGYGLFEAANTAQFTYIERYGVSLGFPDQRLGFALLTASLMGIPGAFTIVVIGHRFGRLPPLLFGIATAVSGLWLLIVSRSYTGFFLASCCLGFSWAFCLPFIQSLMASIDARGSAIAAGSSIATVGGAFGPGLAALILGAGLYQRVFLLSIALFAVTALCFVVSRSAASETAEARP